jgi:hypothetical protein
MGRAALDISRDFDLRMTECEALCCLGEVAICAGEIEQAREVFRRSEASARRYGFPRYRARSLEGLGHVFEALGQTGRAEEYWELAIATYPDGMIEATFPARHLHSPNSGNPRCFRCEVVV